MGLNKHRRVKDYNKWPRVKSETVFTISASSGMDELIANIQNETGGLVSASKNRDGALVLSNASGSTIKVEDDSLNGGSGFSNAQVSFNGFLKLEATNSSPISIEHGKIENIGKSSLSLIGSQTLSTVNTATQGMASEAATPLSSGGFVAAFERANGNFYYQRFDANGEKVGAEVEFLTAGVDGYVYGTTNPSACKTLELSNGSVVIAVCKKMMRLFFLCLTVRVQK